MNKFAKFLMVLSVVFFAACGDENPFDYAEDKADDIDEEIAENKLSSSSKAMGEADKCYYGTSTHTDSWCCTNYGERCSYVSSSSVRSSSSSVMSEADKCYYGTSTHTDSWCCTNYGERCSYVSSSSVYSSSSSAPVVFDYLTTEKEMLFTLTYYKQTSANWDLSSNSYTDGDPHVSFVIYFIQPNGSETKVETEIMLDEDDIGEWEGSLIFRADVPALTETIKVCPKVVDHDPLANDNMSSKKCYSKSHVGRLDDREKVEQSDYYSENYDLEWNWYLY